MLQKMPARGIVLENKPSLPLISAIALTSRNHRGLRTNLKGYRMKLDAKTIGVDCALCPAVQSLVRLCPRGPGSGSWRLSDFQGRLDKQCSLCFGRALDYAVDGFVEYASIAQHLKRG